MAGRSFCPKTKLKLKWFVISVESFITVYFVMFLFFCLLVSFAAFGMSDTQCSYSYGDVDPTFDAVAPDTYAVVFDTTVTLADGSKGEPIVLEVNRSWAPIGADHFYALVKDRFYDCAAFFRVVPNFVVQYGIAASPEETAKWNSTIMDDPVLVSNLPWTVTYATAGPDTRTTQLFINYVDNSRLDADGFAPFGVITSGFDTALQIYNPTPDNSNGIGQERYTELGNDWILKKYPDVDLVTTARLV